MRESPASCCIRIYVRRRSTSGGIPQVSDTAPTRQVLDQGVSVGEVAEDLLDHAVGFALVDAATMAHRDTRGILSAMLQVEEALVQVNGGRRRPRVA